MQAQLIPMTLNQFDVVYTPDDVARDVVGFFQPTGLCLDPCKGDGAFLRHLPQGSEWCEIEQGRDFFGWSKPVAWIVGNPPYSTFYEWLSHAMGLSDNIGFLIPTAKILTAYRTIKMIWTWGGIPKVMFLGTGRAINLPLGFAIGAVHFQKGYTGPTQFSFRTPLDDTPER
jgi:hypothetical protein